MGTVRPGWRRRTTRGRPPWPGRGGSAAWPERCRRAGPATRPRARPGRRSRCRRRGGSNTGRLDVTEHRGGERAPPRREHQAPPWPLPSSISARCSSPMSTTEIPLSRQHGSKTSLSTSRTDGSITSPVSARPEGSGTPSDFVWRNGGRPPRDCLRWGRRPGGDEPDAQVMVWSLGGEAGRRSPGRLRAECRGAPARSWKSWDDAPALPVKAIARQCDLNISTSYHLVRTLAYEGYLVRLPTAPTWIGEDRGAPVPRPLTSLERPPEAGVVLRRLSERVNLSSYLGLLKEGRVTVVEVAEASGSPYLEDFEVGLDVSAHATALGRRCWWRCRRAAAPVPALPRAVPVHLRTHTDLELLEAELGAVPAGAAGHRARRVPRGRLVHRVPVPGEARTARPGPWSSRSPRRTCPRASRPRSRLAAADLAGGSSAEGEGGGGGRGGEERGEERPA